MRQLRQAGKGISVLIFGISYLQSYFPPERTRAILGRFHGIGANTLSALLGTVTPFCSCSSIPLFIGFTSAGLPIGVTFSFLISSPLVDLASVLLLASIFNWRIAIAYVLVGIVLAVIGGTIISALKLERYVESFAFHNKVGQAELPTMTRKDRISFAKEQLTEIIHKVWPYTGVTSRGRSPSTWPRSLPRAIILMTWPSFSPGGTKGKPF